MRDETMKTVQFQVFRAKDAPTLAEAQCMTREPYTPVQRAGMDKVVAAGILEGAEARLLVNVPGFSLTHAWFKPGYPLSLHSHDAGCLYFIIAGSIRLGTEDLNAGDSFFVPAEVPYSYRPGAEGVEILEFRHENTFNIRQVANSAAYWEKAAAICATHLDLWRSAARPKLNAEERQA